MAGGDDVIVAVAPDLGDSRLPQQRSVPPPLPSLAPLSGGGRVEEGRRRPATDDVPAKEPRIRMKIYVVSLIWDPQATPNSGLPLPASS